MDPRALFGTILTTAAVTAANTGGIVAPPGSGVHTGSTYQSIHITNTVQGDNSGGTSITNVETNDNGVVQHSTKTEHIPPGSVEQITVSHAQDAARVETEVRKQIHKNIDTVRAAFNDVPVALPPSEYPEYPRESGVTPVPIPETIAPDAIVPTVTSPQTTPSMPLAAIGMHIQEAVRAFMSHIMALFHW